MLEAWVLRLDQLTSMLTQHRGEFGGKRNDPPFARLRCVPNDAPHVGAPDGLTTLQLAELRAAVSNTGGGLVASAENAKLEGGRLGEPTLLSVAIALGPSVISAVALWLAKQKKERVRKIKFTKVDPNGAKESFELDESSYDEGESSAAAIRKFLERSFAHDPRAADQKLR